MPRRTAHAGGLSCVALRGTSRPTSRA